MNPKLDKMDNMINRQDNPVYRKQVNSLLESVNLTVCFRDLYPYLRWYTWHSRGKPSRLDYRFISEHLLNESYKILPGLHSDHSILKVEIGSEPHNRGKGLWKFNHSSLHESKMGFFINLKLNIHLYR